MDAKAGREFLARLRTTQSEPSFLAQKQQFELQVLRQRYAEFLKGEMAALADREHGLLQQLNQAPKRVKSPSLAQFFELFVEEQRLQHELSQLYAGAFSGASEQIQLLEEISAAPQGIFAPQRVLSAAELRDFKRQTEEISSKAFSALQAMAALQNDLPLCNATFSLFTRFDQQKVCAETLNESFLLQVAALAQSRQQIDVLSAAFGVDRRKLLAYFNAIQDKRRQNRELSNIMEAMELQIAQAAEQLQRPGEPDAAVEPVGQGDSLTFLTAGDADKRQSAESGLGSTQARSRQAGSRRDARDIFTAPAALTGRAGTSEQPPQPQTRPAQPLKPISLAEPAKQDINGLFEYRARAQAEQEMREKLQKARAEQKAAENTTNAVYTAKITELRRLLREQAQMVKNKAKKAELEKMQRRIDAAERDALTVRPQVEFSEARLHAPTQVMVNRQRDTAQRQAYSALDGVAVDGEQVGAAQFNAGSYDMKPSFVAMNVLAERGLLATQAAQEALAQLRAGEVAGRFGGCLRDDVARLFQ